MDYLDLTDFANNKANEKMLKELFLKDYKSLGKIKEIKQLILTKLSVKHVNKKLITKIGISLDNIVEQLHIDYTDIRTKVIHGDYKDFKTAFYLWRSNALPFLYRIYIVINLINYATKKME